MGRGGAIQIGMEKASGEYIGYIDCDLEIKLEYLLKAFGLLQQYDIVVASKFASKSKVTTTLTRKISSIIFNFIVRRILGSEVGDHQAGLKVFRKNVIKKILPIVKEQGWLWDIEVLVFAQRLKYIILEIPMTIKYGFRTMRKSFFIDFIKLPLLLLRLKIRLSNQNY